MSTSNESNSPQAPSQQQIKYESLQIIADSPQVTMVEEFVQDIVAPKVGGRFVFNIFPVLDDECHETGYYRCVIQYPADDLIRQVMAKFLTQNMPWITSNRAMFQKNYQEIHMTCPECNGGKTVTTAKKSKCEKCRGRGYITRIIDISCPKCRGAGEVRDTSFFGLVTKDSVCDKCDGKGVTGQKTLREDCPDCIGKGETITRTVTACNLCKGKDQYYPNK